ncbi:hypothetical protein HNP46_005901 [Pseudomonas nitritireducens]|uniref:DUF3274 domain-containing protein n=1 Tax=Pseudomonas nitroreducens TaxID=46680 RepID=A0A7W7P3G9_PSENT|nr:DUF3274 domain-containing protein [Pseudomonas nitritireducens]MBB4866993.1 hypothetical protein [Pseudomonas nitritireducens]
MNDAVQARTICSAEAITLPKGGDVHLIPPPPKPCITIVVHGVNDLAGCYERLERGLCQGLNERLDIPATLPNGQGNPGYLIPASYSVPSDDQGKAENPDAVYYRRKFSAGSDGKSTRSVVVPFYWGFREEEEHIQKTKPHGEWLDRNRNRLDKAGTKEGGQFANATTNLPDMWGKGFNGKLFGIISLNAIGGTMTHPLFSAAGRKYMILAAKRLAMLIKIIRKRYPNDTINVVGHSQGTLLSLLAHAFLKDDGVAPADGVVMLNSPYSLFEPFTEKLQGFNTQQTTQARLTTLTGILDYICARPNMNPALSSIALKNCQGYGAIGGAGWTGSQGSTASIGAEKVSFDERDNRGCAYLYFTPQDQIVGLANVQGIGWRGVGDQVKGLPARTSLPQRFYQRIFTLRKRNGEKEKIGLHTPPYVYPLLQSGEATWEDTLLPFSQKLPVARAGLSAGETVMLTAPLLPIPAEANFDNIGTVTAPGAGSASGVYQVLDTLDPIDAAIGVANGGWKEKSTRNAVSQSIDLPLAYKYGRDPSSVERALNEGKDIAQQTHVFSARDLGNGMVLVTRAETPYEARLRLQTAAGHQEPNSFHSAIPNNPEHSRQVLAYDLAIGAGDSVDDAVFYQYLCRVADWRLDWEVKDGGFNGQSDTEVDTPNNEMTALYRADVANHDLIDATVTYHKSGEFPQMVSNTLPSLVATQTIGDRRNDVPVRSGGAI